MTASVRTPEDARSGRPSDSEHRTVGRANRREVMVAGQLCVVVLMVVLIAASFALDLHGYLAARRHGKPRHGRRKRR